MEKKWYTCWNGIHGLNRYVMTLATISHLYFTFCLNSLKQLLQVSKLCGRTYPSCVLLQMLLLVSWILIWMEWLLWEIRHNLYHSRHSKILWGQCQYKCNLSSYMDSHHKDEMVMNLYNENSFTLKHSITIVGHDVHAKGQGKRSKVKITEVKTQLSHFRTVTPV